MLIGLVFIFSALLIGSLFSWIIDNNGSIIINWLGYEITTDILTILLIPSLRSVRSYFLMRFESENVVRDDPFLTLVIVEELCA